MKNKEVFHSRGLWFLMFYRYKKIIKKKNPITLILYKYKYILYEFYLTYLVSFLV